MSITPEIPIKTVAIKLKPKSEVLVKKQHPWVFDKSIVKESTEANSGDYCCDLRQ